MHIAARRQAVPPQVDDRVCYELARPVERRLAAARRRGVRGASVCPQICLLRGGDGFATAGRVHWVELRSEDGGWRGCEGGLRFEGELATHERCLEGGGAAVVC